MRLKNAQQCQTGIILSFMEAAVNFLRGNPNRALQSIDSALQDARRLNDIVFRSVFPGV